MKTLRYIWMVAMLIVLCGGVQAVTYGKSYKPQYHHSTAYYHAQASSGMPAVRMGSAYSTTMYSGSALPLAAATGVTTSYDTNPSNNSGGPRRMKMDEDEFEDEEEPEVPVNPNPLGDGILPMMLLIGAYCGYVTLRRRKHVKMVSQRETLNG